MSCGGQVTLVQAANDPASPSYAVPSGGGVITSWSHVYVHTDSAVPGISVRLKVFREAGAQGYLTVGHSALETPPYEGLWTFPTRISVEAGDVLGLHGKPYFDCYRTGNPGDQHKSTNFGGADPSPGSLFEFEFDSIGTLLNVEAVVEPDADRDGYGDETQDGCPESALSHGACPPPDVDPPETTITRRPKDKTSKRTAKFKFAADEAGSTFDCRLKGKGLDAATKQFNPCLSPRKYRSLDPGKYVFKVRATDIKGNTDPTPAKDKFNVVR